MMHLRIREEHLVNALDGYLHAMSMIDDDDFVVSIKKLKTGDYEVSVEKE